MMMMRHGARSLVSPSRQQEPIAKMLTLMGRPRVMCRPLADAGGFRTVAALSTTPLPPFQGPAFVRAYLRLLESHPILTKSATAAAIFGLADATSQGIQIALSSKEDRVDWDFARSLRMLGAGLLLSGPSLHFWFTLMSRTFPSRDILNTLKKMALGQMVYGPIFNTAFFSLNAYLQGETTEEIMSRLKRDLLPAIRNGLMYWPLCDFLTYRYVPVHLQPLVNNSFAYLWTIYLTYMASLRKVFSLPCVEVK